MKTTTMLVSAVLASCGTDSPGPVDPIALGTPAGSVTLTYEAKGHDQGGYDLFHPTRPTPLNGSVWVLDTGNDQLVRFDSTLSRAQSFGREGEGPGEIQFATDMASDGERLVVAEA